MFATGTFHWEMSAPLDNLTLKVKAKMVHVWVGSAWIMSRCRMWFMRMALTALPRDSVLWTADMIRVNAAGCRVQLHTWADRRLRENQNEKNVFLITKRNRHLAFESAWGWIGIVWADNRVQSFENSCSFFSVACLPYQLHTTRHASILA